MEQSILSLCRLCLRESENMEAIFEQLHEGVPLSDIIRDVCNRINISQNDKLPKNVCIECSSILLSAYKLNEVSLTSEQKLYNMLELAGEHDELEIKQEMFEWEDTSLTAGTEKGERHKTEQIDEANEDSIENEFSSDCNNYELKNEDDSIVAEPEIVMTESQETPSPVKRRTVFKRHECPVCNKLFEKPSKLARHITVHDKEKRPFACEEPNCHSRFITKASLDRHAIMHSGMTIQIGPDPTKTHTCVICSKTFQCQEAMASHMRSHKDEMKQIEFPCTLCSRKFKKLNDLTRHSRTHEENKNYKCQVIKIQF